MVRYSSYFTLYPNLMILQYVNDDPDIVIQDAGEVEVDSDKEYEAEAHQSKHQRHNEDEEVQDNEPFVHNMHPHDLHISSS
jgi:hypothetical protein